MIIKTYLIKCVVVI